MPTAETQPKEVKKENFANIREALEGAGTRVLSRLDDAIEREVRPTLEDIKKYREENKATVLGYGGPYTDLDDERNAWTYVQETPEETPPTRKLVEEAEAEREKLNAAVAKMRESAAQR